MDIFKGKTAEPSVFIAETPTEHSVALVTGITSGLGHAAARLVAIKGYRRVIITGRSLARVQETAAQLAAETKTRVFTSLEIEPDSPSSVQSSVAELVNRGKPINFLLLNAAGVEVAQAQLISDHQLTVGLLHSASN
jgi:NADP-dependent 3-hydroxy acid dehydrogenase YdfG